MNPGRIFIDPRPNGLKYFGDRKRHMVCYPYSIENLHIMAKDLDIKPGWFHKNHYDMPLLRKTELLELMDEVVSPKVIVQIIRGTYKPKKIPLNAEYKQEGMVIMNPKMVVFKK